MPTYFASNLKSFNCEFNYKARVFDVLIIKRKAEGHQAPVVLW